MDFVDKELVQLYKQSMLKTIKQPNRRYLTGLMVLVLILAGLFVYTKYSKDISLAKSRTSNGGKVLETACGVVQYSEFGDGPPMLIIHGSGGGFDQGEYFAKKIGGSYRWISPSRFGYLGTPIPTGADSDSQAQAYSCLLDSLGIDRVGIVGVSMGGPSALLFAQKFPERTTSLTLVSAVSHANPPRPAYLEVLFSVFLDDFVFWSLVKTSPEGMLMALGVPKEVQKMLSVKETVELDSFLNSMLPMSARKNGQNLEQHMSEYDSELIRSIKVPTMVLHAPDDTLVSFEQGEFSIKNIPNAKLVQMDIGGHLAMLLDVNANARKNLSEFLAKYNLQN